MTKYYEIEESEQKTHELKEAYLKRFGWNYTCNTPGSYWLYQRDFVDIDKQNVEWWKENKTDTWNEKHRPSKPVPYGIITTTMDMAVRMTLSVLDHDHEQPEDDEL